MSTSNPPGVGTLPLMECPSDALGQHAHHHHVGSVKGGDDDGVGGDNVDDPEPCLEKRFCQ